MRVFFKRRALGVALALAIATLIPGTMLLASDAKIISSVEVESDATATQIILRGAEDPIYTAFMREDPPRLIIDLPDVMFDGVETPIQVGDAVVESITLGAFGDPKVSPSMARVSIALRAEAEYELLPQGNELIVRLLLPQGSLAQQPPEPAAESTDESSTAQSDAPSALDEAMPAAIARAEPGSLEPVVPRPLAEPPAAAALEAEQSELDPAAAAEPAVSRIVSVLPSDDSIEVKAEGPIDNVDSFALSDPDRIVIDFWGAQNGVWPDHITPDRGAVSRVRVGAHADKVRLVLDLRAPLESHTVEPTADGVLIRFKAKLESADDAAAEILEAPAAPDEAAAEVAESEPMAAPKAEPMPTPEPAVEPEAAAALPEPMPAAEPAPAAAAEPTKPAGEPSAAAAMPSAPAEIVDVHSVHFESLPTADRVVVTLSAPLAAHMVEPDAATLIVELPGARIDADAERRVDTREFSGPVEVFSAFRTPELPGENVRVVLKRKPGAAAELRWSGSQLHIEFPHADSAAGASDAKSDLASESLPAAPAAPNTPPAPEAAPAPAPSAAVPVSFDPFEGDLEQAGPAAPAAIDVLEEGGFAREKEYKGRRISLDFKDAEMANVLRLIAEVSDLNVIAGEEVSGKVTLRLVDVPWDQALDIILLTKGLGFVRIGNILRIAPVDVLQREEQSRLQERRAREKLEDLVVKLQPVNYANVTEVQKLVKRLLSSRGSVIVDKRTSTLILKDIPSVIHEATALIKAIDTMTPQVLIEAKIVEASLDFSRSLGARWGVGYNHNGGSGGNEDFRLGDATPSQIASGPQDTNFLSATGVTNAIGTLTMGLLGFDNHIQLDLALQAGETSSKGKVISSPRVVTLDNRTATIQQGVAIRFDASDGDSVSTSFVDAVLKLDVTPHITSDRSIIMKINVSRNAPQLNDVSGSVIGITKNETATETLVRDGQTMVLGGIYTVDKGSGRSKVPFLADIPLLGAAFRNQTTQDVRRELLIFVTPHVVQEGPPGS